MHKLPTCWFNSYASVITVARFAIGHERNIL